MPTMNQAKFMTQYIYALSSDFVAANGAPAKWGPDMPSLWGSESKKIKFNNKALTLALSDDDSLLAVGVGTLIHIYTLSNLEPQQILEGHSSDIHDLHFVPKNRQGYKLISHSDNYPKEGSIIVWDLTDHGKDVQPPEKIDVEAIAKKASNLVVETLKWQPKSKMAQSLEGDFRSAVSTAVAKKGLEGKTTLEGSLPGFGSVPFSRDGNFMFIRSHNSSTQSGTRESELLPQIEVWDLHANKLVHRLRGHTDSIMWIGMSPNSTKLASVAWDGTVRIWSVEIGECLHKLGSFGGQMWAGVWSPDSKLIAFSQGSPKTVVYVYNIETGDEVSRFEGFKGWARSMAWSSNGKYLVSGGGAGVLCVWDPTTGKETMRWELTFGDEDQMMKGFVSIVGVTFVGTKLVFQSTEGTIEAYDFKTNLKSQFTRGPNDKVDSMVWHSLAVSHTGKFVVSGDADNFVRIWNFEKAY